MHPICRKWRKVGGNGKVAKHYKGSKQGSEWVRKNDCRKKTRLECDTYFFLPLPRGNAFSRASAKHAQHKSSVDMCTNHNFWMFKIPDYLICFIRPCTLWSFPGGCLFPSNWLIHFLSAKIHYSTITIGIKKANRDVLDLEKKWEAMLAELQILMVSPWSRFTRPVISHITVPK